jgi:hypothetical protein
MMEITSVKELFAPLGKRLQYYELGQYQNWWKHESEINQTDFFYSSSFGYQAIIDLIFDSVNKFDHSEIYKEAEFYEQRILKTFEALLDSKSVERFFQNYFLDYTLKLDEETKNKVAGPWYEELNDYLSAMRVIKEARSHVSSQLSSRASNVTHERSSIAANPKRATEASVVY